MELSSLRKKTKIGKTTAAAPASGSKSSVINNKDNSRNPLSDVTNKFNLIPTETLSKLLSTNSISASDAKPLLRRSQQLPISHSESSIGSSNFNTNPTSPAPLPYSCSTNFGDKGNKLLEYHQRKSLENLKGQRKVNSVLVSSNSVEKINDEGKVIYKPFGVTHAKPVKDKGKAIAAPLSSTTVEKLKDKGKAIAAPLISTSVDKLKAKGKRISVHLSSIPVDDQKDKGIATRVQQKSTSVEKQKDKGKTTLVPFTSTSVEKTKDKGKAVAVPLSRLPEMTEGKEKSTTMLINCPLTNKRKRTSKRDVSVLSCPPLQKTRSTWEDLQQAGDIKSSREWTDPHPKHKKRKCREQPNVFEHPSLEEFVKQQKAYFEEVDAFELPVEEVSCNYNDMD